MALAFGPPSTCFRVSWSICAMEQVWQPNYLLAIWLFSHQSHSHLKNVILTRKARLSMISSQARPLSSSHLSGYHNPLTSRSTSHPSGTLITMRTPVQTRVPRTFKATTLAWRMKSKSFVQRRRAKL